MIELLVSKSSELVRARGSGTQRVPSTTKAYSCRPFVIGTDTVQAPFGVCVSEVCRPPHPLKSPTSATLFAGPTKTNRTNVTVSWIEAVRIAGRPAARRVRPSVPRTAIAAMPAASASPEIGERRSPPDAAHQAGVNGDARRNAIGRSGRSARMAAISDCSKSSSKRSAAPSRRDARSMIGSFSPSWSDIVHLLQQYLEVRTRALHSHLEGGHAVAGYLGHFFVGQMLDVLHQ